MGKKSKKPKETSPFLNYLRDALAKVINNDDWKLSGERCLMVKHSPTEKSIIDKCGDKNFVPEIWIARPDKGKVRCSFEIAGNEEERKLREKIADSIRSILPEELPDGIKKSKHSTILRIPINLSRVNEDEGDTNLNIDENEIKKIISFYTFLNQKLAEWNKSYAIEHLEISAY